VGKLPTIGFLGANTPSSQSQWTAAFVQRLRDLGWIEGRTVAIEYRWAEGRSGRYLEIAAEFVRFKVDVIVTAGNATLELVCGLSPYTRPYCKQIDFVGKLLGPRRHRDLNDPIISHVSLLWFCESPRVHEPGAAPRR
jgi:hypothetical protein